MTAADLQPTVTFSGGPRGDTDLRPVRVPVDRLPPRDTCDGKRWSNCTSHHLACDCREAEQNGLIGELRAEVKELDDVLRYLVRKIDPDEWIWIVRQKVWDQKRLDTLIRREGRTHVWVPDDGPAREVVPGG